MGRNEKKKKKNKGGGGREAPELYFKIIYLFNSDLLTAFYW